jgi:hypothetical protein
MRVMLNRLDLVTGALAPETETGARNAVAGVLETGAGARNAVAGARNAVAGARNAVAGAREIAGAVAHEAAAEGGTMRLNPNVKLEDIIIWIWFDCYRCVLI